MTEREKLRAREIERAGDRKRERGIRWRIVVG